MRILFRVGRLLEPQDFDGLRVSLSEVFALGELEDAGTLTQQELADRLGLEKSTVSRLTAGLQQRGWLSRERDPANRRFYRLNLTPEGQDVIARIGGQFHEIHERLFVMLTPDEHAGLSLGLGGLVRAFEALESQSS